MAARLERYSQIRKASVGICALLEPEDYQLQAMSDVSPPKWHLAHTSWFFEEFLLKPFLPHYQIFNPQFSFLFNSYYKSVGSHWQRPKRGLLSRPTLKEVLEYREYVDREMMRLLGGIDSASLKEVQREVLRRLEIGLNHEEQHQELLVTDIKYNLSQNPLFPKFQENSQFQTKPLNTENQKWISFQPGIHEIGHEGEGFAYDNEGPKHKVYIHAFEISNTLVTNAQYLEFIRERGYQKSEWWLSLGWDWVESHSVTHPLYWIKREDGWYVYTSNGLEKLELDQPVSHINYFEADAYARWKGFRLPTEFEWEIACKENEKKAIISNFFGQVWQWTQSSYSPYPGFAPEKGALGEYNGKFMCNQYVLRGSSYATPKGHSRSTYRNFFPPDAQWQVTGLRLARSLKIREDL